MVITNNLEKVQVDLIDNATSSTHQALEVNIRLNAVVNARVPNRIVYDYKKADWNHIFCLLSCIHWSDWSSFTSVDEAFQYFYDILHAIIEEGIPTFNLKNKKFPRWSNKKVISLVKQKERKRDEFLRSGRDKSSAAYSSFCTLRKCAVYSIISVAYRMNKKEKQH